MINGLVGFTLLIVSVFYLRHRDLGIGIVCFILGITNLAIFFHGIFWGKPTKEQIAALAKQKWQQAGCPVGRDSEFWHKAERELKGY